MRRYWFLAGGWLTLCGVLACGAARAQGMNPVEAVNAVGVESQYADVIGQIGGQYVHVSAIETDPNTDPHTFEVSPQVARQIAAAEKKQI